MPLRSRGCHRSWTGGSGVAGLHEVARNSAPLMGGGARGGKRPYTFVVMSMLIAILGALTILRMPTDIFPDIDIPVISVVWNYSGLSPEEMEKRIVNNYERGLTTTVNDIEHIESQSLTGVSIIKIFFQPGAKIEAATAQVTAISQTSLRQMPPGTTPPFIIRHSASRVP